MHYIGDVLGDEGRKALDACVKVKIFGRPQNIAKYHWDKAKGRLDGCYAGRFPGPGSWGGGLGLGLGWLQYLEFWSLVLPTEWNNKYGHPKDKICDIVDIHDALENVDKMLYVEKYPKPGPKSDALKELIDKRRADIERECEEATADPDAMNRYSWLVAQRRVRDCYAGSFAGDGAFLKYELERNPNELYNIIDIHDAVVHFDKTSFFDQNQHDYDDLDDHCNDMWKKSGPVRENIAREFKEAHSNPEKVVVEYARDEAEKQLKDCYRYFPQGTEILPIKMDESGMPQTTQTYSIFDIHKALEQFDEKKMIQKYPEDEGPGSHELKKSIEKNNSEVIKEYWEAKRELRRYSRSDANKRVRDCFLDLSEVVEFFPIKENESRVPDSDKTYDIFDIHKMLFHHDRIEEKKGRSLMCVVAEKRETISKEYQKARNKLGKYSLSEAERRARDCFAGTFLFDTDIFVNKEEEKCGIPRIHQTYDIFDIKNAVDHFDAKKLRDKYLDAKDTYSKQRNQFADDKRKKLEEEYAEATSKVEIEHGSGFIVHDHFIITNKHVIVDAVDDETKEIRISNVSISKLSCEVCYTDAGKDLALLYCPELNLEQNGIFPLQLSNQTLLPGMQVFSFGYPMSHTGESGLFVNGHVSGSKETYSGHKMIVLNCALNSGNSGGPVLCFIGGQLKVVGVATQKHFKEILTLDEREKIEKIRESMQTCTICSIPDDVIKDAELYRDSAKFPPDPDPCNTPMNLLTLKLYDALETHSQFNLSNALPGHCVVEFIQETISKYKGQGKDELFEILKWSEDHANILPSGHHSASDCCIQ